MAQTSLRNGLVLFFCLFCSLAHAAELPDLIARLETLAGKNAVSLSVHVKDQRERTDKDEAVNPIEQGDFTVAADAQAVTVSVAGKIPDSRVFQEFSVLRANTLAHFAPQLVREFKGLQLVERRPVKFQGASCQHWRLRSQEKQSQFGINSTTVRDVELWLDPQGYPLQALFKTQVKGRMLLFKFNSTSTRQQRFERVGGRLILLFDENKTDTTSKAGTEKRTVTTTVEIKEN